MARSTARKRALNTLYEADEKGQDIPSLLAERIAEPGAQTPLPDYAIQIVRGVADEQAGIDRALEDHSTKWPLRRMAVVDRNILRIAAWEILFNDDVPDRVAIDEGLGLAKTLSDDDSPSFIHGLLSAICDDKDSVLADIKAAHEAEAKEKAEREAAERRLNSPTAPGFLQSHGISGEGDGVPFETMPQADQEADNVASSDGDNSDSSLTEKSVDPASAIGSVGDDDSSVEASTSGDGYADADANANIDTQTVSATDAVSVSNTNTDAVPDIVDTATVSVTDDDAASETLTDSSGKVDEVGNTDTKTPKVSGDDATDSSSPNEVPNQPDSTGKGQPLPPDGDNNSIIV